MRETLVIMLVTGGLSGRITHGAQSIKLKGGDKIRSVAKAEES